MRFERRLDSVVDMVGRTPLVRLRHVTRDLRGVKVYLKLEYMNPGGSVKDRPALQMMRDAIADGRLTRDKILIDSTSGNTGVAYAMLGAAAGIGVTLCLPANASVERQALLNAYGAEVVLTDPLEGTDGAIRRARELAADRTRYWYADQYNNPANPRAHMVTTAEEIWRQTSGRITHLVAGLGTTGTLMGTGRRLKELRPDVELVAVQPDGPFHGLEGMKHLATAIVPGIYDASVPDRTEVVATEDAEAMVRALAREAGLFVGWSTGAAVHAAAQVLAREGGARATVVVVAPDSGMRYLSERARLTGEET